MLQALNPKDARVLVVEDGPNDQEIAMRALKTFGIRHYKAAKTGEEGLREAEKRDYDVCFVDYNLPGINGLQFVERLRQISPHTSVIVVTGVRQESIAVQAMKLGVADYISKDEFLTSGIIRALQAALRLQIEVAETEQREVVGARSRELQEASIEATWLLQALDERHGGYRGSGARDPMGEEWSDAINLFVNYIRMSYEFFPAPATDDEDALLRVLIERKASPRDLFRLYIGALQELMKEWDPSRVASAIRPVLFLNHVAACLIEEYQVMISLKELDSGPNLRLT